MTEPTRLCGTCGMPCTSGEYHPYAACLMFKACHNSETVRANLEAVRATQAQAGAVPLTDEQAKVLLKNSDLLDMFLHIGWYSAPRKNFDAHGLTLIRAIEAAHGIKGGQHGSNT